MSYEGMTKREAIAELRVARDDVSEVVGQLEAMRRLHEAATERNVELAALIEQARAVAEASGDLGVASLLEEGNTDRAVREMKHRLLVGLAEELDAKGVPGLSVGATWLRKRAIGILVGVSGTWDKHHADGRRSA